MGIKLLSILLIMMSQAETYSISKVDLDAQQIYFGTGVKFKRAARVNYEKIIKATPEYADIKSEKVKIGTGRYWILLSRAGDRAIQVISEVGASKNYDFIASEKYLIQFKSKIPSDDITPIVIDELENLK